MPNILFASGDNLNDCLQSLYSAIYSGESRESCPRGKRVREWPGPVLINLKKHENPWTLIPGRRFNPYFAIAEVLWILAGRNDVDFISTYNKNIGQFSDDGIIFHGAYGDRIRNFPETCQDEYARGFYIDWIDQLALVIDRLQRDPYSRQSLLCLWDPSRDLKDGSRDYPCNNLCYFTLRENVLDMSVVRRSNDMLWGLPYNSVQFYFIHAVVAGSLGAEMGVYTEFVQNMHVYLDQYPDLSDKVRARTEEGSLTEPNCPDRIDRRISLQTLDKFLEIFFLFEKAFRMEVDVAECHKRIEQAEFVGIPKYWIHTMLCVPLAFICRKRGLDQEHEDLIKRVEPDVRWLIEDFKKKG